ncbi:thioredoxin-domain-containing protein [Fomitiporia mediterranea MF3/22]|uniref:thioredoxin-domain-containing protein n=1 Tax=Fomitiporia mediterranea (strain MF3/22) TaxID=694068 RepID=UPI0004408C1C|nr:thioredoxin-domain-containing protein [Fomitiporia mediterranea MF3/22]EJD08110.1 thioredoxin-domain-containing protein [Fomitiporia mediterranea MF3/22]
MRLLKLVPFVTLLITAGVALAANVITLTASDFNSIVNKEALIMVNFFTPWCSHCKALAPKYEEAATTLKAVGIKLVRLRPVSVTVRSVLVPDFETPNTARIKRAVSRILLGQIRPNTAVYRVRTSKEDFQY